MIMHLISRPGRPVHLAVFAYDANDGGDYYFTGHYVPLCGQDRGARWRITGPWHEKWARYVKAGVCSRCQSRASDLLSAIFDAISARVDLNGSPFYEGPDEAVYDDEDDTPPLFEAIEVAS